MKQENPFLRAAPAYAKMGFPVFPIKPGDKRPLSKNGLTKASLHHADATEWLLGFRGVIDCLYMDGPDDPNANLSQLIAAYDRLRYLVVVDDTQEYEGNRWGKGSATLPFLEGKGWVVRHYLTVPGYRMSCATRMPSVSMTDSAP